MVGAFYFDDPSSNPTVFYVNNFFGANENKQKVAGMTHFLKNVNNKISNDWIQTESRLLVSEVTCHATVPLPL